MEISKSMARFLQESHKQVKIAFPTTLGLLLYKLPWIISLHFVGKLGAEQLAAASLASTLCNITGLSFSVGLSTAITTLTGQARGKLILRGESITSERKGEVKGESGTKDIETSISATESDQKGESKPLIASTSEGTLSLSYASTGNAKDDSSEESSSAGPLQPLVFLYRGIAIQLVFVIPIGFWWLRGISSFLLALGQGATLSIMTERYLRILTPGLWAYATNCSLSSWLQSIEIADVPAWAAFIGLVCHVPLNILFVYKMGYGYLGVAMATSTFQIVQPIITFGYLFGTARGRNRILENMGAKAIGRKTVSFSTEVRAAVTSVSGIKQYLSLALPGVVIISEWWASECAVFLSGRLYPNPDFSVAAMSIYQTINTFFFMFPVGFAAASSARVGLFLGMGDPDSAKLASRVSIAFAGILSGMMGLILILTPHDIFPSIFTKDKDVLEMAAYTIPFLSFYVFADGVQVALNGIIKGCGMQSIVMPIVVFAYWVVAIPLAYYNSFLIHNGTNTCKSSDYTCGVRGLVSGMTTGTWMHFLLLLSVVLCFIDWGKEAATARKRMAVADKEEWTKAEFD